MKRWLVGTACAMCACASVEMAPDRIRVNRGPAHGAALRRVLALPATCGTLAAGAPQEVPDSKVKLFSECEPAVLAGVDTNVRSALEFQGYQVIDGERVNATTMERTEVRTTTRSGAYESESSEVERRGSAFADAPPRIQDQILTELGADGLLNTRVWIGATHGVMGRRRVEVQVRLLEVPSRRLVWARRCEIEVAGLTSDAGAMHRASTCAARGEAE